MTLWPIAASDMDVIIGIIAVIGWILAQVLGRKKGNGPSEQAPPDSGAPVDPQDELRKFFEEMEKTLKPQPEPVPQPAPPPPPVRVKPSKRHRQVHREEPPPVDVGPSLKAPVESAAQASVAFMQAAQKMTEASVVPSLAYPALVRPEELKDPATLRKMVVAMEVLGKPVALRLP